MKRIEEATVAVGMSGFTKSGLPVVRRASLVSPEVAKLLGWDKDDPSDGKQEEWVDLQEWLHEERGRGGHGGHAPGMRGGHHRGGKAGPVGVLGPLGVGYCQPDDKEKRRWWCPLDAG